MLLIDILFSLFHVLKGNFTFSFSILEQEKDRVLLSGLSFFEEPRVFQLSYMVFQHCEWKLISTFCYSATFYFSYCLTIQIMTCMISGSSNSTFD